MRKLFISLCISLFAYLGMASSTLAAPMGWYELGLTWRDGSFSGKIQYDSSSPYQVLQVQGQLTTLAQTTAITDVWNLSNGIEVGIDMPLTFTNWDGQGDPLNYNAAFSIQLSEIGQLLAVGNPGQAWGLYDWSDPVLAEQLSDSPLLSWTIAPMVNAVPEPGPLGLFGAGVIALALSRRFKAHLAA